MSDMMKEAAEIVAWLRSDPDKSVQPRLAAKFREVYESGVRDGRAEERKAIVTWLRGLADAAKDDDVPEPSLHYIAAKIEQGGHVAPLLPGEEVKP